MRNIMHLRVLQILIYALQSVYAFGENAFVSSERNQGVNNFTEISSYNYIKHITLLDADKLYPQTFTDITEFPNETTKLLFDNIPRDRKDIQNLTIDSVSTEWIYLSWQPPCEYPLNETLIYFIDINSAAYYLQINTTNTGFNATQLDPCSEYNFTITVISKNWQSNGISIIATTSNNISKIGDIRNPVVQTSINTISLSWKAPENYSTCVYGYLITQCFRDSCENIRINTKKYVASELKPCEKYFFTIKSISYFVQSDGFNITLKTNSPKTSKPLYSTVEATAFSLFVHWQPPEVGAVCIKYYRITINPELTILVTGRNTTIHDLYACTSYTIYINAVDEDNNDGEKAIIQTRTAPTVSRSPILNTKNPTVTKSDIILPWRIEKGNSNCSLTSLKVMCNATSTNGHGYEVKNGHTEILIDSRIHDEFLIVNSLIKDISPFTTYICWAYVVNEAGNSELSNLISVTTLEDIPSAPRFNVINITYSQFAFVWEPPIYLAGNLHEFEIIVEGETRFPIPDRCEQVALKTTKYLNGSIFVFEYLEAKAYTYYKAKIKAKTNAGWGNYSSDLIFQTPAGVPGMISNFSYLIANSPINTNVLDTILTWGFPCSSNGILEYFNIFVYGTRTNYPEHSFTIKKYISNDITPNDIVSLNLKELKAEYNYTFHVCAKVKAVQNFGLSAIQNVLYPAGIPSQPDEDYVKSITINPDKARRSTTSATLLLPLFPDTNGNIIYYSIIVSRIKYNVPSHIRFDITNCTWPNISSWAEAMLQDFIIPYQATRLWWNPYPNYVADYGDVKAVKYTLGEDTNCQEISSNTRKRIYCNGPLKPNTWYHVRIRAFTHGGYSDSATFLIKTNAEINVGLVTGVVFGILFLGILTTMVLLVRKCSLQIILRRFLHSDMSGSPVPAPFSKKKFIAHCQQLIDNPGKLSNEFQLLQTLSVDLQMPTNTACLQANKKKNRYSDILPYDFSRVKLEIIDNDPNTDYINASFIKGYSGENEYIACQGPKEDTTFDFWRMVEQYNVNVIVMLTNFVEKGKEKCHQYFPAIRETFKYEKVTIKCLSELDYRSYTQRMLILQKENKRRNITHLHFKEWPDHDVPEDFDLMIHFCQIVRRNILASKEYIVIHCSAGSGRTGTLIAIDILLQHLRDNRKLDVFGTVYRLRHSRINMVQKESQYAYVYNCIKQVLKNPYCLKSYKPPPMEPFYENTSKKIRIIPRSNINLVNSFEIYM